MSYNLQWTNPLVDAAKTPVVVPVGTTNSTDTSLSLTGKGAANYGGVQQQNILHLLENFADFVEPSNATIGQQWYDASSLTLKVLVSKAPNIWKSLGGLQVSEVGAPAPSPAALGDMWFQRTGSASGFMYVYTGIGRYPSTDTTIGGWDQIFPNVETAGGREEYDELREMIEMIAGSSIDSFGSGAIRRAIQDLTNFAELDRDLRTKYQALVPLDANVLVSTSTDGDITRQAMTNGTLFHFNDGYGDSASDGVITGAVAGVPTSPSNGQIYINGVLTTVPAGSLSHDTQVDDAYIMYDKTTTQVVPFTGSRWFIVRYNVALSSWQYEISTIPWTNFTPTAQHFIVGTHSTFRPDNNTIYPSDAKTILWAHAVPMVGTKIEHLKVEPNSQDWDALLAAAKYALNRLELSPGFVTAISPVPFVTDGRQAPATLLAYPTTDVRYPTGARRSGRKVGTVTQVQNFAETVNALRTAFENRFSLRGINGATGTNTTFGPNTTNVLWAPSTTAGMSGVMTTGNGTLRLRFRFANPVDVNRFYTGGGTFQIAVTHTGGATTADTNFRTFLLNAGVWRISGDRVRFFGQSLPLTVTRAAAKAGLWNANLTGQSLTKQYLTQATLTVPSMEVRALRQSATALDLVIVFDLGGVAAGTTSVDVNLISDTETYTPGTQRVYPTPLAFAPADVIAPL